MSNRKSKIDLSIGKGHKLLPVGTHKMPVVPGVGDRDIDLPDDLIEQTIAKAQGRAGKIKVTKDAAEQPKQGDGLLFRNGAGSLWDIIRPVVPKLPDADYQALVNGAEAIQKRMVSRQFDDVFEQLFGDLEEDAEWAVKNMPAALNQSFVDHQRQIVNIRTQVENGLPKLIAALARKNPGAPPAAIIEHAMKMLAEQLGPVLSVLQVYSAAIKQYRSGRHAAKLRALNLYMGSCYSLWLAGDPEARNPSAPQQIPTSSLQVGQKLLSMIGGPGLGTIPGAKGPVGLSLLMYPIDMVDWISLSLTLNAHEGGHQIFADIKGFEDEMQKIVEDAVAAANSTGALQFTSARSAVGRMAVSTRELIVKMITDCIGEIEADVAGVLVNGPAFLYGMLLSFPAMLIRDGRVRDAKQLLRTGSVYMLEEQPDGSKALEFEPHPPDYIRAYMVAAMVEEIGYKSEADLLRRLADQMVGKVPDALTWKDAAGESRTVISIKVADIKAVVPVVAKALLRTKLKSLGRKSLTDLVLWGAKQQTKALAIKDALLRGESTLPANIGTIYPTLIGSGAALAYWEAIHSQDADVVLPQLEENVLKMLAVLDAQAA